MTSTFLGFDLNPFACYLAEINLLMQCLPFLLDEQEQLCRRVDHFHIYCADVLEPTTAEQARIQSNGKVQKHVSYRSPQVAQQELSEEKQRIAKIKNAKGLPAELTLFPGDHIGIDYLLGNPPYVSASESPENLSYRDKVWSYGIYSLLHQRWDLFVPFFERNLQFLRPSTGRLSLIVSNGIETEGYAERLRQKLSRDYRLLQLDFFPELRLFPGAAVESTIVVVENRAPEVEHVVKRRKHLHADCQHFETLPPLLQLSAFEQIFRWRYDAALYTGRMEGTIPLCAIAYIGTGIEAQSNEMFDPIIDGRRWKRFTLDDVFLCPSEGVRPPEYIDNGVLGDDVDDYFLHCKRCVAYEKYCRQMRSPRHPALFRTPEKLLLGETLGGYYDRSGLFANHSVQVVVPWRSLEQAGVLEERGIQRVYRKSCRIAGVDNNLASIAGLFDLRYLLGIINSRFIRQFLVSNMHEGTRKNRIYPDVWKRLPVKVTSAERQRQIGVLVEEVQEQYERLALMPSERQQIQGDIDSLLAQIEGLVEETYRKPADGELMEIIRLKGPDVPIRG